LLTSGKHYAPGPPRETIGDWEFFRTPMPSTMVGKVPVLRDAKIVLDLAKRLDAVAREVRPDILHAHSPVLNALAAIHIGRRLGIPVIYEVRAFWEDAAVSHGTHGDRDIRYFATKRLETFALRHADAVTTICEGLRRDVVGRGIPTAKVTVIPNAVDRTAFSGAAVPDAALTAKLGLVGKTILGFFGSFYFYEGLHLLLRSLPELRRARPEIALLLVGGGPEEERLRALARDLRLGDSVVFTGRVRHEDMQKYYDLADLLVFPRVSMRLTELVTPLKPLEAMAQERIVLASDVGGHRELVRDRSTGYLFPPDDPGRLAEGIIAALNDRESWPRIRARALQFVESERSWTHSVGHYKNVYESLLSR
jgi:PEP-CTERM/exosortase A-associated glycosyltransferase